MLTRQALDKIRQICSRQEKCPADVLTLLKRWGVPQEHHQEILEDLRSGKFLDEYRYAAAFVADKIKFDHWGLIKIRYMLQQKGIARHVAEDALREINPDDYRAMVGRELAKKRKTLKGPAREVWAKLARYGSSRGYEMEVMQGFLGDE
jgi:regulatory protein